MTASHLDTLFRNDLKRIATLIPEKSTVLDLGCGNGALLAELMENKGVRGRGIDIDEQNLINCVERGISVSQGNIDSGLSDYPDKSYDYVILNQTLQVTTKPEMAIREMLRVGRHGVVGFPNFGHWTIRLQLLFGGRMPKSKTLPFEWYDTPNIHLLTIDDFREFCRKEGAKITHEEFLFGGSWTGSPVWRSLANLFARNAIFVVTNSK